MTTTNEFAGCPAVPDLRVYVITSDENLARAMPMCKILHINRHLLQCDQCRVYMRAIMADPNNQNIGEVKKPEQPAPDVVDDEKQVVVGDSVTAEPLTNPVIKQDD
jgi:hypothetical protein